MTGWRTSTSRVNRLTSVRESLPDGALELASHAAVPVALDAAFLNLLRVNFFVDPPLALPFEVEADLLTSPLFREVGEGLYEIDRELRNPLLVSLVSRFGAHRLAQVAMLLEQYTDRMEAWRAQPELEHAQRLTALSLVDPPAARRWLAQARSSSAGTTALGREWFVAMGEQLDTLPDPSAHLGMDVTDAVAIARDMSAGEDARVAAVHRLGQLGLLPGTDVAHIGRVLFEASSVFPGPVGDAAGAVLETLTLLVPPPDESLDYADVTLPESDPAPDLTVLLGIGDAARLDPSRTWAPRPYLDRLRVPIGVDPGGRRVILDLKEPALDGMGPHGLLVGTGGSGKTELLRTLVAALAVTHSPDILNVVLVYPYGGQGFRAIEGLPHVGVIAHVMDEPTQFDRVLSGFSGELARRQELLRTAGHDNQRDYERARAQGAPLPPLPSLLMVFDEFNELLNSRPDLSDLFVQIGRLGRSFGLHLLLASERLDEGALRGLHTHLSYRIALRTFSAAESRLVIGLPDARDLPVQPGHGYLRASSDAPARFRAAYVSRPYPRPEASWDAILHPDASTPSTLDVLVSRMEGQGPSAHRILPPPLAEPSTLDQLLSPLVRTEQRGVTSADPQATGALRAVVGVVDMPFEQRRDPMWLDLSGGAGNLALAGGPQSGKSNFLRTLVASLALTHTPQEVQFYCLDFGGGALAGLRDLPHVGSVAGRRDVDRIRRTVGQLHGLLLSREGRFAAQGVDGIATYRRTLAGGLASGDPYGDVFLVVDGWSALRAEHEDLEPVVTELATRGLGFGIHILATCTRWMEMRPLQRDMFGTKVELRLGDPGDSQINRRKAQNVPEASPGRGLTPDGHHFLAALPRIDGQQRTDDLGSAVDQLVMALRQGWTRTPAPPVALLPAELPYDALPPARDGRLPIGIAESDLQPVFLDVETEPHLLVFGDGESGKSSFLRALARAITDAYQPSQARILLVDYRRSLLGDVSTDYLVGYGTTRGLADELVRDMTDTMARRVPGPDVSIEQLRNRSWWDGPELFLLVDDYELVATGANNPLLPLVEFLPKARDIGLHVVLARAARGAGRAMFDPLIGRVRELGSPGIVLSGPSDEGPLVGNVRPRPLPPGRGWLVTRREGGRLVQLPWVPPADIGGSAPPGSAPSGSTPPGSAPPRTTPPGPGAKPQ